MAENFTRASTTPSTTASTDLYQVSSSSAANRSVVISCLAAAVAGVSSTITVDITDASNALIVRLASTIVLPANSSIELITNKLVLLPGEKVRITTADANAVSVSLSLLEIS